MSHPMRLTRYAQRLQRGGVRWLIAAAWDRLVPARPAMRPRVLAAVAARTGLEIGGPSRVFAPGGMLPVYGGAVRIDNVNFATDTAWESAICDGGKFRFHRERPAGTQWVREAVALAGIASASYDFVFSSHGLEHVANPLAALTEWHRVTRAGGHLLLVLPDPAKTFDHRRPMPGRQVLAAEPARPLHLIAWAQKDEP